MTDSSIFDSIRPQDKQIGGAHYKNFHIQPYEFISKKLFKYSSISYIGLYDIKKSINTESGISYSYFDECFGVNIDFKRNSYSEETLKPQDIMTVMFSFKNLGSYKSTNIAVSETDKQDIEWESVSVNNDLFN